MADPKKADAALNFIQQFERDLAAQLGGDRGRAVAQTVSRFILDAVKASIEGVSPAPLVPVEDFLLGKAEDAALAAEDKALSKLAPAPSSPAPAPAPAELHPSILEAITNAVKASISKVEGK